jgi:hypothetical protein
MVSIPRENLSAEWGHQYDYANKVDGCITGKSDGEPWMVCREIVSTIQDKSPDTITVILQVKELKTIGGAPDPDGENEHTDIEEYPVQEKFAHADVPLYNAEGQPAKIAQSDKDWPAAGEVIVPLVKNWHTENPLRIDTDSLE